MRDECDFATDGSGGPDSADPRTRRAGWAWAQMEGGELGSHRATTAGWGTMGSPRRGMNTIAAAELVALLELFRALERALE